MPPNASAMSATCPAGPVTYTERPSGGLAKSSRIGSTTSPGLAVMGTMSSSARPSSEGMGGGPCIVPSQPAISAPFSARYRWSSPVMPEPRSATTMAGIASVSANWRSSSVTRVDSADSGRKYELLFSEMLLSLPAYCPPNEPTASQTTMSKAGTSHRAVRTAFQSFDYRNKSTDGILRPGSEHGVSGPDLGYL